MASPSDYDGRIKQVLGGTMRINPRWNSVAEAKLHLSTLRQMQQQLRLIKREIGYEMKSIHSLIQNEKARVGIGLGTIVYGGIMGKKNAGKLNAARREDLRIRQNKLVAPYQSLSHNIETMLIEIDRLKLQIETWIAQNQN